MPRRRKNNCSRGYMLLEAIVSMGLLAVTLAAFAQAASNCSTQARNLQRRQQAKLAAEAALNEMRAGIAYSPEKFAETFPGLSLEIAHDPGTGQWQGLTLVSLRVRSGERGVVLARLEGYLPEDQP